MVYGIFYLKVSLSCFTLMCDLTVDHKRAICTLQKDLKTLVFRNYYILTIISYNEGIIKLYVSCRINKIILRCSV